jgi:hypothetical protein
MADSVNPQLVAGGTEATVCCTAHGQHKLIGRLTIKGAHFWCKICRSEHVVTWASLLCIRQRLAVEEDGAQPANQGVVAILASLR